MLYFKDSGFQLKVVNHWLTFFTSGYPSPPPLSWQDRVPILSRGWGKHLINAILYRAFGHFLGGGGLIFMTPPLSRLCLLSYDLVPVYFNLILILNMFLSPASIWTICIYYIMFSLFIQGKLPPSPPMLKNLSLYSGTSRLPQIFQIFQFPSFHYIQRELLKYEFMKLKHPLSRKGIVHIKKNNLYKLNTIFFG